jgi:hypothetical protein
MKRGEMMKRVLGPGQGTMRGLGWLARVGPSPIDPWRYAMGWSKTAAWNHAARLEREGWLERSVMERGSGSLFLATWKGVRVLGIDVPAARPPEPAKWAHDIACAWTAAWLTYRRRRFLGPRELLCERKWSAKLDWRDGSGFKKSGHRPDFVAFLESSAFAIEVELARKSRARLDAIFALHLKWIVNGTSRGLIYIVADDHGRASIERTADRAGVGRDYRQLRICLLDAVKAETIAAHEASRCPAGAPAGELETADPVGLARQQ